MPLLKRETEVFPEQIFGLKELPWWVAHIRSRQEKALARYLEPLQVPFYLPQHVKETRRQGRRLVSHLPLFPGYLFFRGSLAERRAAIRSNLVVRVLEVADQVLLDSELAQLRRLQDSGASLQPCPSLQGGDVVRVIEGPFEGYRGVVLQEKGRSRFVISITVLRKSVAVEIGRNRLAPVSWITGASSAVA